MLPTKPCRLAFFHVGSGRLGRKELAAFKLTESPLYLFGYFGRVVMEPFIFGAAVFARHSR
jgi:hypothetical protein